ncbi:MAG TPA: hemolysin family protein [Aggregatilinea sp.]|uniref:hemolysin family protein n=1 Tax=Aggregatilinea sp. TaxID=2806333 RepID=UPI002B55A3F9|nr:hemolysin family protein [Aggregatilinea sp.]HML20720.1 hemolysin family protein [Aggregatilinea sp.]
MILTLLVIVLVVTLMLAINALYVAGEFATVSARKPRITQLAHEGNRLAQMLLPVIEDPHRLDSYIAASQVGITLSSIVLGIYGEREIAPRIEPALEWLPLGSSGLASAGVAAILVLAVLTTLQVVFGELVPKAISLRYPEEVALFTTIPMRWSGDVLLKPLIILLNGSGTLVLKLLGAHNAGHSSHVHSPEEIMILISESEEGGLVDAEERRLLDNVFRTSELSAGEIAVPRTRLVAASADMPVDTALKLAAESAYTRIPIYQGDMDHPEGFVHLRDLFRLYRENHEASIETIMRPLVYVPETMPVNDVWQVMNRDQSYLAMVFDEYGGTVGMVTREDLIEELFGEVQDEFDVEDPLIARGEDGKYIVRGDTLISMLNEHLDLNLPDTYAYTIGGLVLHEMGRIPKPDDEVSVDGIMLHVDSVSEQSIQKISLTLPHNGSDAASKEQA